MDAVRVDAHGMIQGIASSERFIIVATKEYFERPWPVFENIVAEILRKPVLVLLEQDARYGGLSFESFCSKIPEPWKMLVDHEFLKIERRGLYWMATIEGIKKRLELKVDSNSMIKLTYSKMEDLKLKEESTEYIDGSLADLFVQPTLQPISSEGSLGNQTKWQRECKMRATIISELLRTEESYIVGLTKLINEFLKPFTERLTKITNRDISSFQVTIETLIDLHNKIYHQFCNAKNICIVFQQEFKFLKIYKSTIKEFEETYRSLKKASTKRGFKGIFMNSNIIEMDPLDFVQRLGITIIQRTPRYVLLFKQLKRWTPVEHPMYLDLEKGLKDLQDTYEDINEYQQQLWSENQLLTLSEEIDAKDLMDHGVEQLIIPSRKLIRLGKVEFMKRKTASFNFFSPRSSENELNLEQGGILMCNDILIILRGKKNHVQRVFHVAGMNVDVNNDPMTHLFKGNNNAKIFEVIIRCMDDKDFFSFFVSTLDEAKEWERCISKYSRVERKLGSHIHKTIL